MEYRFLLPINLRFFDGGEKTEQATPRKKQKAREEGQVAKSQEISTAALFLAMFFCLRMFGPGMITNITSVFSLSLSKIQDINYIFTSTFLVSFVANMLGQIMLIVTPIFAVAMISGIISSLIQVGWHPTTKPLKPKFSKLNPVSGFKRLFSLSKLVDLLKALLKMGVIIIGIYVVLKKKMESIPTLMDMPVISSMAFVGEMVIDLGLTVGGMYLFVAAIDYFYTRFKHNKQLRMSKQEVKEEHKMMEGNPQIKAKIRQKMREVSMRRMMHSVPSADVIITNPTHIAVALKYEKSSPRAPIVVAKGVDFIAKKIREKAMESNIQIVENKPLARAIYQSVDIGREIPPDLYQAVAEILAFVYKLKNKVV